MTEGAADTRIRAATVEDLETILRHRRCMFADMGQGDDAARERMVAVARPYLAEGLASGAYRGWLVEAGGQVVAGAGLATSPFQPTPFDPVARRAWIVNVYTEPAFRRRGLAKGLVQEIVAWCGEARMKVVFLHASVDGRPIYEGLGFTPTAEMRFVLDAAETR